MLKNWMKWGLLGAAVLAAASSFAVPRLPDVAIERALYSETVTVRFEQPRARMIELRVNGRSVGTRAVNGSMTNEAIFRVDQTLLDEGDNEVEALVFDEDGRLIEAQKRTIAVESSENSPVQITLPKSGQTVQGLVEIRMELTRPMGRAVASFMVNGEWKAIRNFAPYQYILDTETLPNGWHEIQVWVVDNTNVTWRSRKIRILVNNPGGRTERNMPTVPATPVMAAVPRLNLSTMSNVYAAAVARPAPVRSMVQAPESVAVGARHLTPTGRRVVAQPAAAKPAPVAPAARTTAPRPATQPARPATRPTTLPAPVARPATTKPVAPATSAAPAARVTPAPAARPTVATPRPAPAVKPVAAVAQRTNQAVQTVRVTRGTRLSLTGPLTLSYGARVLNFDVQPRVQNGIPFTPFRHLYEAAGGQVKWDGETKTVNASGAANSVTLRVGSTQASVNGSRVSLEYRVFIERGRSIVPLSFIGDTLNVNVDVDPKTGHVLITKRDAAK